MKIVNLIFILFCLNGCTFGQNKTNIQRCFLQKSKLELSKDFYGKHILLKGDIRVDSINGFINITDDRELFQKYSFEDKISILTEYLMFVGDTTTSNKFYKFRPSVGGQITRGLEVQIEALFSFSMMLINGYPSIRPILYYKHTKEKVILNEKLVQEIYDFYEEWLITSKETDFKEITWPLAKTPYMWDGEKENIESYLIESLK